jgi:putative toxin-antitoxin system antitoxin component (TIGR02293 family)
MKPSSQRLTIKPKKDATQAAAAPTIAKNTLPTAHVKTHGIIGMKTVKAKIAAGGKPEQQAGVFVAFEGSSVMAHDAVMKGVSGRALTRIWESTRGTLPTDAVLKAIGVSVRTAHRVKTEPDKPLDARTTDGIYRLESVRAMAKEVLGSVEAANEWLMSEAMGLEFRKPIDLVSTSPGAEAVKTLLQRMRYGVYA